MNTKYIKSSGNLLNYAFIIFFLIVLIVSCKTKSSSLKSDSLGSPGELLIVIDPEFINGPVMQKIVDFANREFPSVPQSEPTFKITSISLNEFERHFKTYRNIIVVKKTNDLTSKIDFMHDVWAFNQQLVQFSISDTDSFCKLFDDQENKINDFLYYGDIRTMAMALKKDENVSLRKFLNNKYNIDLVIPKGYRLVRDTSDFSWFRYDYHEVIQNVLIKSFSLDSIDKMEQDNLLKLCNEATRKYVPGPANDAYMTIEDKFPLKSREINKDSLNVVELRGLWKVQGYFMGGPFVNYFIQDLKNNRVIMIEAFVYAPQKLNKSFYVRQMESILYTLKLG